MTDTTWHPYSERRPTALERAAERYREACAVFALADEAKAAAERAHRAAKVDARGLGVEAYDALVTPVRAALYAAEDAFDDAFAAREATADALLEAARGER